MIICLNFQFDWAFRCGEGLRYVMYSVTSYICGIGSRLIQGNNQLFTGEDIVCVSVY